MNFSIIVAIDYNNGIGKNGKLPWNIKKDMEWFVKQTTGKPIIMGLNTYFSLPNYPLKNRKNIVLTKDKSKLVEISEQGATVYKNLRELLKNEKEDTEYFIIGGSAIYEQFMYIADKIYVTKVFGEYDCDTFFPIIDNRKWVDTYESEIYNEKNVRFMFKIKEKKK
jgi:dihydrofolate reductase